MKSTRLVFILFSFAIFGALNTFAFAADGNETTQPQQPQLRAWQVRGCETWIFNNSAYGTPGWICAHNPFPMIVPNAYDTKDLVRYLGNRIDELEKRILELEKQRP